VEPVLRAALACAAGALFVLATSCSGELGGTEVDGGSDADTWVPDDSGPTDGSTDADESEPDDSGPTDGSTDADSEIDPPTQLEPCDVASCWSAPDRASPCGTTTVEEDFSTGRYNVHEYAVRAPAGVLLELSATRLGGAWEPALILHDELGTTISDGERATWTPDLAVEVLSSGRGSDVAALRLTSRLERELALFLTGWAVVDGGFGPDLPADAEYLLTDIADCEPESGLLSPPNFDPTDVDADGYYLMPPSDPEGLYTRKEDDCSRGTRMLIDVLYTVAVRWHEIYPDLSPIAIRDMNEGWCSTVDHATHDDGTHADIVVECATDVSCADDRPAIDLAMLFVDTLQSCGVINNNTVAQAEVNPYFESRCSYEPWHYTYMRSVSGHTGHFHIRVMPPDGSCN